MIDLNDIIKSADEWRSKNNPGMELNVRTSVIDNALREAVRRPYPEAIEWLCNAGLVSQLRRISEIAEQHNIADNNFNAVDLALLLNEHELAGKLLQQAQNVATPFWKEYYKALSALHDGRPYKANTNLKLKGWIATFEPYLKLIEALTAGTDLQAALAEVDAAVAERNSNKKQLDPGGVDGDGQLPAVWDLRKHALMKMKKGG